MMTLRLLVPGTSTRYLVVILVGTTTSISITSTSEQAIDKAISNIQNQDAIPQNMKTDIVTMMEGISDYVNHKIQTTIDQAMAPFFVP